MPACSPEIIKADAAAGSYFVLKLAPANAPRTIDTDTAMIAQLSRRLIRLWPELGRANLSGAMVVSQFANEHYIFSVSKFKSRLYHLMRFRVIGTNV